MRTWFCFLFLLLVTPSLAQFQFGLFGGVSDYNGDLLDKPFRLSRPAGGLSIGYQLSGRLTAGLAISCGKIEGADSVGGRGLQVRNLSFQSSIQELALTVDYNLFSLDDGWWTPFAFTGLALYHYNPYTFDQQGQKFYLQPLGTEGQGSSKFPDRKPYRLTGLSLPVGGGIKFMLADAIQLAALTGLRITNNDYLDDVSKTYVSQGVLQDAHGPKAVDLAFRGDELPGGNRYPTHDMSRGRSGKIIYNDFYYFTGLQLTIRLGEGKNASSQFSGKGWNRKRLGCFKL